MCFFLLLSSCVYVFLSVPRIMYYLFLSVVFTMCYLLLSVASIMFYQLLNISLRVRTMARGCLKRLKDVA